jgi:Ca2+-transporting ATPase
MTNWNSHEPDECLTELSAKQEGLTASEASRRLQQYGLNELVDRGQRSAWRILREQLTGALVILLFVAAGVSLLLGEYIDAVAIVTIIVLNAILGFVQDYRAEKSLAALKKLAVPGVRVRRDGQVCEVSASELVPGDVILLEAGNSVPADCRLLEVASLKSQESALTGESEAVEKTVSAPPSDAHAVADRTNMVWMGTAITYGHATAVVVQTGMQTQLGQIASSLQSVKTEPTPLQQRLARLGRSLAILALAVVAIVFTLGLLRGEEPRLMLMTALSLAVAVVPEGLPAVATVALALGARSMVRRQALIRKLPAVETLGSVTVICSDKTGTLTQNRMTVSVLDVAGKQVSLNLAERTDARTTVFDRDDDSSLSLLLTAAALCNDAELSDATHAEDRGIRRGETSTHSWEAAGDPTEAALVLVAAEHGLPRPDLERILPRIGEIPFDSDRRMMTTLHQHRVDATARPDLQKHLKALTDPDVSDIISFTKGAADRVVAQCTFAWSDDSIVELNDEWRQRIDRAGNELAGRGMRVLGLAMKTLDELPADAAPDTETEMVFLGLMGMIDPPRKEARDAVSRCRDAGIRPVMITGDHPLTALHIAKELGIANAESTAVTGRELSGKSTADLESLVDSTSVYARVSPSDKLNIVRALQNRGEVVSMTGDGVNDAPALKQAHIGVAMGKVGTDVSKEASDMVLLDDNFATIVNAVEQGRIVYDNIRKFVRYTMTSNAGEVGVMLLGPLIGMPMALLPLQILWVNLVTDGLPGLALSLEPAERNTMKRPPYALDEHVINRRMVVDIGWIGLVMAVISLSMGYWYWSAHSVGTSHWRTMVFTVLTMSQMGNALAIRSERDSLFRIGLFSNVVLLAAVTLTFILQMVVIYAPPLQKIFQTSSLSGGELIVCMLLSTVVFFAVETAKWIRRSSGAKLPCSTTAEEQRQ